MELLKSYALRFVGLPYRWGGDDSIEGFDCSGLVQEILASVGMDPPGDQTAQSLFNYFDALGRSQHGVPGPGALAFYGQSVTKITHVAFMLDQHRILEAGGGGSKTVSAQAAASQNAYVRIRLLKNRPDLVAVLKPRYATIGLI